MSLCLLENCLIAERPILDRIGGIIADNDAATTIKVAAELVKRNSNELPRVDRYPRARLL
jgi:hypothetical protein